MLRINVVTIFSRVLCGAARSEHSLAGSRGGSVTYNLVDLRDLHMTSTEL